MKTSQFRDFDATIGIHASAKKAPRSKLRKIEVSVKQESADSAIHANALCAWRALSRIRGMQKAADEQRRQNRNYAFVVGDNHPRAAGRQVDVVNRRHGILPAIGGANAERHKRRNFQMLADVSDHGESIGRALKMRKLPSRAKDTANSPQSS